MPQRPTRLELHRLKYRASGGRLELLSLSDLDAFEKGLVSKDFFSALYRERRKVDPYGVYAEVLSSWGVMCPHPPEKVTSQKDDHCFYCEACGSYVTERDHLVKIARAFGGV